MKSRVNEILDKSIAAMVSAIEIYNKPDFMYREETFSILAVNSWELLIKAKWLKDNEGHINSLYVYTSKKNKNGNPSRQKYIKRTKSDNPFTHSLDYLARKLSDNNQLNNNVLLNLDALTEIRDSSIHFYNRKGRFSVALQEVGSATLKNYVILMRDWFQRDLSNYNFYLMPLSFINIPSETDSVILNKEEENFIKFLKELESHKISNDFSITINTEVKFTKSKTLESLSMHYDKNPDSIPVYLTQEQIQEKYPLDYKTLVKKCNERYEDFKVRPKFHNLRKNLLNNDKFCHTIFLNPKNREGSKKTIYNANILMEFDKHYTKK